MITNRPPRLDQVWVSKPVFFITTVSNYRKPILASKVVADVLVEEWRMAETKHGWAVGEYVIMPDHVHFFCRPWKDGAKDLQRFVGAWKEWTARRLCTLINGSKGSLWQPSFFDRLMRMERDWEDKRIYMLENPVRAGLCLRPEGWPFSGDLDMFRL